MTEEVEWNRLSARALCERAENNALVLLPVASTEQHGPHLATGVDTFMCAHVCRRAARLVARQRPIVVAPTVWMGLAEHHMAFGGTFTVSLATWHAILRDLCQSILRAGFTRIVIVNGHGGNMNGLNALVTDLTRELDNPIASTSYWNVAAAGGRIAPLLDDQTGIIHACEAETSMMMAAHPDLVDETLLGEAHGPEMTMADILNPPLMRWRSIRELTPSGVLGQARNASAEKGERLLDVICASLAQSLIAGKPWDDDVA